MADDNSQLLNSLMGMLGDHPEEKINAVLNSLTGKQGGDSAQTQQEPDAAASSSNPLSGQGGLPDLSMLMKMQGILSQLGGSNDDRTNLLLAIKPFLSEARKPHVDRTLQLLKLTKLAETAKEMDLLKDFKL